MTSPSDPGQKGVPGIVQDGMSDEGSKKQADQAGGQSTSGDEKGK